MQIKGRDYQVLYTKESKEVQVAIDLLSMVEHKSLTVEYKERKAFLTPFCNSAQKVYKDEFFSILFTVMLFGIPL